MDNTVLRNAGVALMQSTDAFNVVEGMTLAQIGQALYDFAAMRESYARLLAEVKHLRAEDAMLFHQNAPPSFH